MQDPHSFALGVLSGFPHSVPTFGTPGAKEMLGAILGDVIGSVFEGSGLKITEFPLLSPKNIYTDDTVLTVAVASAILDQGDYAGYFRKFGRRHPNRGYGGYFQRWLGDDSLGPYNSWGNGSAMRVCPVGWAFDSVDEVLNEAKRSADVTHNHPEGVRGAQAVALSVYLARRGAKKIENPARDQYTLRLRSDTQRGRGSIRIFVRRVVSGLRSRVDYLLFRLR